MNTPAGDARHVIADPQPSLRKRPLIVISHGNWGSRCSQGWLALQLVKVGYVVLSTSHPGTIGDDDGFKAFYIMGSGPGQGFTADSLKSIRAPFLVDMPLQQRRRRGRGVHRPPQADPCGAHQRR